MVRTFATETLRVDHLNEWIESGVDPELIRLNVKSISGEAVVILLYPNPTHLNNRAPDWKTRKAIERYINLEGWEVRGIDPIGRGKKKKGRWEMRTEWGRFKPDIPVVMWKDGKPAKYLSPQVSGRDAERAIFLEVPDHLWKLASEMSGIPIGPEDTSYWQWVIDRNVPILIAEGEKKAGCGITLGYPTISVPGINSGYRKTIAWRRPIADLLPFNTKGRTLTMLFDWREGNRYETKETRAAVRMAECMTQCTSRIAFLPGKEKGLDDFVVAGGNLHDVIADAVPLRAIQRLKYSAFLAKPTLEFNRRYLGNLNLPETGLVVIKSPRGTGKTRGLRAIAKRAQYEGIPMLVVSHRIVLGRAIASSVGLPWVDTTQDYEYGRSFGFGLCIDSLHPDSQARIEPGAWDGAIIVFDEVEQVLAHLLHSSTLRSKGKRTAILDTLQEIVNNASLVIIQDADLTDVALDFFRGLYDRFIDPFVVVNQYQVPSWPVKFFDTDRSGSGSDDPSEAIAQTIEMINNGGRAFIATDGQKAESKWGTTTLEQLLQQACPDKAIIRIDSETIAQPGHPAFGCGEKIDSVLSRFDAAIVSPSLATGVSIDLKGYYSVVVGIFQGVGTPTDAMQSLARVRDPVLRLVWASKVGVARFGTGETSDWQIRQSLDLYLEANRHFLNLKSSALSISASQTNAIGAWSKIAARQNAAAWDYRAELLEELKREGHRVQLSGQVSEEVVESVSQISIAATIAAAMAIAGAGDISEKEYLQLKEKRSKSAEERHQETKYRLKDFYGVGVTPPLYILDRQGWGQKIRTHYYLHRGRECLKQREREMANEWEGLASDIRFQSAKVGLLAAFDIEQFLEGEWHNESPEAMDIAKRCKISAYIVRATLGFNPRNLSPIQLVGQLLNLIGFAWEGRQIRRDGKRVRLYRAAPMKFRKLGDCKMGDREPDGLRDEIFAVWEERDRAEAESRKAAEAKRVEAEASIPKDWREVRDWIVNRIVDTVEGVRSVMKLPPAEVWDAIVRSLPRLRRGWVEWALGVG